MLYPRFIIRNIKEALQDTPVVLINGARQTGKTTLVNFLAKDNFPALYITLDDLNIRSAAQNDPVGFLKNSSLPVFIDEIQLVPELLPAIKMIVDQNREPGRFIITGSANILTLPKISESLAGRMEILTLYPLSQVEIEQSQDDFTDRIFRDKFEYNHLTEFNTDDLWDRICNGGYPEVINRKVQSRKEAWFRDYIKTIIQRDIRDLANIEGLVQLPRLFELLAARASGLLNYADISRSLQIPQTSLKRYIVLLEATFLLYLLPAWSGQLGKRLVKAPKIYITDSGLLAYLKGLVPGQLRQFSDERGSLLETFVLMELRKQIEWRQDGVKIFHFRGAGNREVDFLLENRRRQIVGIEVKAASTVRPGDFAGLKWLKDYIGGSFKRGLVLYTGNEIIPFGDDFFAVPVPALWTGNRMTSTS